MELDPSSYTFITYAWIIGLSLWSGIVGLSLKLRKRHANARPYTFLDGFIDLSASILVGILTFYICEILTMAKLQSMVIVTIAAHTGPHTLYLYRKCYEVNLDFIFRKFLNVKLDENTEIIGDDDETTTK
jgi:hypothetical protein